MIKMIKDGIVGSLELFTLIASIFVIGFIALFIHMLIAHRKSKLFESIIRFIHENYLILGFIISTVATLGSLFYSEIMNYAPCVLCWYQRIAMYPLVALFLVGMFQPIKYTIKFTLPVVSIGLFIAIYHNLLHYGIVPETASPCRAGVPCSTVYINWLGFITIPMLSAIAFALIFIILLILLKREKNEK